MKVFITSEGTEQVFHFEENTVILGRSSQCKISLKNDHISRKHMEIIERDGLIYVKDLTLSNWVATGGERIPKETEIQVFDFTVLRLPGNLSLKIYPGEGPVSEDSTRETRDFTFDHTPEKKQNKSKFKKPKQLKLEKDIYKDQVDFSKQARLSFDLDVEEDIPETKEDKQFKLLKLMVIFLIIGGGSFFLLDHDGKKNNQPLSKEKPSPKYKTVKPKKKTLVNKKSKKIDKNLAMVKDFIRNPNKCLGKVEAICNSLIPSRTVNEGIQPFNGSLVVFKNFDSRLEVFFEGNGQGYKNAKNNPKTIMLLAADRVLNPEFLKLAERKKFYELKVFVFTYRSSKIDIRGIYKIDTSFYRRFDKADYEDAIKLFKNNQNASKFERIFDRLFIKER